MYIVRHAIAERRDAARWPDDAERPLTPAGETRFRRAVRGLRRIVPEVQLVLSSPYTRAWQTAAILHQESAWPAPERCKALEAGGAPTAAAEELLARRAASVALVGHEPQLSLLASLLVTGVANSFALELKKGGVVFLDCPGEPAPGEALLRWSVSPKILRSLDVSSGARRDKVARSA